MLNNKSPYACLGIPTASIWCREARKGRFGHWILADVMQFLVLNSFCIGSTQFRKGFKLFAYQQLQYSCHPIGLQDGLGIIYYTYWKIYGWNSMMFEIGFKIIQGWVGKYLGIEMRWDWLWVVDCWTWVMGTWWVPEVHCTIYSLYFCECSKFSIIFLILKEKVEMQKIFISWLTNVKK